MINFMDNFMKDYMEPLLRLGIFLLIFGLAIYVCFKRKYLENFLGFSDYKVAYEEKIIDENIQRDILDRRCGVAIEAPGFNCNRVGFYCTQQNMVM
tara:strand:+ start:684 stop:971 length:288 start_codon:yes stop_codon:yes gene_type:complete